MRPYEQCMYDLGAAASVWNTVYEAEGRWPRFLNVKLNSVKSSPPIHWLVSQEGGIWSIDSQLQTHRLYSSVVEHTIADRRVPCSNHGGASTFCFSQPPYSA